MNLTTATPAEIDAVLANLYRRAAEAENAMATAATDAHHALGERAEYVTRTRKTWPTSDKQAIAKARELADPTETYTQATGYRTNYAVTRYDAAAATLAQIEADMAPLHAEYRSRPWSRFHPVPGGHIHSSRNCRTLHLTTDVRWLPKMSGQDEATALENLGRAGHVLCTVCFPSAPVQYTVSAPRKTREQIAADKAAAAAQARVTDPKLIAAPDGSPLRVDRNLLRTVRSADIAAVDHLFWAAYARHIGDPNESYAREHEAHTRKIVAALAHKAGTTEAAELARVTGKAVAKVKRDLGAEFAAAAAAVWATR